MRFAANSPDGSQLLPSCKRGKDGRRGGREGSPGRLPACLAAWLGWSGLGEASWASLEITKEKNEFERIRKVQSVALVGVFLTLRCGGSAERRRAAAVHAPCGERGRPCTDTNIMCLSVN